MSGDVSLDRNLPPWLNMVWMSFASSTIALFSLHSSRDLCEFSQPEKNRQLPKKAARLQKKLCKVNLLILTLDKPKISEVETQRKTKNIFFKRIVRITSLKKFK